MEPASGAEGEVRDRGEVAGDDASGYNSPAGGSNYGEVGRDGARDSGRPGRKRTRPHPAATAQGLRGGGRQQGWLKPCGPHRAVG
jgi:hypothetical protein